MSTDFFGSPVAISGRTPAKAPLTSLASKSVAKNSFVASIRYSMSEAAGLT